MTTNRSAAAATIFSRVWAPPPPLISQPSGAIWSAPSIAMSSRSMPSNGSTAEAELAPSLLGRDRRGDAADVEFAGGESGEEVGDGGPGPQPDQHPALDQLGGGLGGEPLLVLEVRCQDGNHSPRTGSLG